MMLAEFEGAPNVVHVAPGTRPVEDGLTWATAYHSMNQALGPNGVRSNLLVIVAPGKYLEDFQFSGSNVTINGAGAGTLLESNPMMPQNTVARYRGDDVTFQDMEIKNSFGDQGFSHVAVDFITSTENEYAYNLTVRRCRLHGDGGIYILSAINTLLIDNVHTGFENAAIVGRAKQSAITSIPESEHTTLASGSIFRIERNRDISSPTVHVIRGVFTALSSSFGCTVKYTDQALTQAFRGFLLQNDKSQCILFGCTVGVNIFSGVTGSSAQFQAIAGQTLARMTVTASAVRARGVGVNVASFAYITNATTVKASVEWVLASPPYTAPPT